MNEEEMVTGSVGTEEKTDAMLIAAVPGETASEGAQEEETPEDALKDYCEDVPEGVLQKDGKLEIVSEGGTLQKEEELKQTSLGTAVIAVMVILTVCVAGLVIWRLKKKRKENRLADSKTVLPGEVMKKENEGTVGKLHHIGRRNSQQDSFGVVDVPEGKFAVVADGMGGLEAGDKVSQKIVLTMLQNTAWLEKWGFEDRPLFRMVSSANREVSRMLSISDRNRSGSTVIAVLTSGNYFQWISVGDSRIYLFRAGQLLQINSEHVYEKELLQKAVNQQISFEEAAEDMQKKRVTSYIGMGELKHIEGSLHPVGVQAGDKIILMSDGVFNTLSDHEICRILMDTENAEEAAAALQEQVLARQNPRQDNFTAVILDM